MTKQITPLSIRNFPYPIAALHIHGIGIAPAQSLAAADSRGHSLYVHVVNHRTSGGSTIEVFSYTHSQSTRPNELVYLETVQNAELLNAPNDVVPVGLNGSFYATNEHGKSKRLGFLGLVAERFFRIPRSNVVYWDGASRKMR